MLLVSVTGKHHPTASLLLLRTLSSMYLLMEQPFISKPASPLQLCCAPSTGRTISALWGNRESHCCWREPREQRNSSLAGTAQGCPWSHQCLCWARTSPSFRASLFSCPERGLLHHASQSTSLLLALQKNCPSSLSISTQTDKQTLKTSEVHTQN